MFLRNMTVVFHLYNTFLIIVIILTTYSGAQINPIQESAKDWPPGWTEKCINCLCEAATGCNQTIGCIGEYCGMFHIGRPYWIDADNPTLLGDNSESSEAFTRCVRDPYCASRTVNQYVNKFLRDCNNDGTLSCDDYARLHYFGYGECSKPANEVWFYKAFRRCFFQN